MKESELSLPDIKAYYKSIVKVKRKKSVVLSKEQENGPTEWNRQLRDCSWIAGNLAPGKGGPLNPEAMNSLIEGAQTTGNMETKRTRISPTPYRGWWVC